MNTTKYLKTSLKLILACLFLLVPQTHAREMQPGSDAYTFSTYMIDAFYSEGEECEEKLLNTTTIGWLCAAFPLGQSAFEERWDAYLSALPEGYSIVSVTPWGDIKYEEDETFFFGKIYDLNDGRLVVGYDKSDRGREIRLGFSSTANQATAQTGTPVQAAPAQVMLTQAETRAREIAQAAAAQQATSQRAYATPVAQNSASTASNAMATATATNLATSAVVNAVPNVVQGSAPMATATTTNLATSAVVNTVNTATAPLTNTQPNTQAIAAAQPVQSVPVQTVQVQVTPVQPAPDQVQAPVNTQEVMAMAQPQPSQTSALSASTILDVFAQQGLSVKEAKAMTTKDYGFAPVLANEGIFFRIGDCTSCMGRIFSFDRKEDVAMMEVYYSLEAQPTDVVFSQDNVLIQFFSTPKDLAEQYITELKTMM